MDIKWTSRQLIAKLPDHTEQDDSVLLAAGLAPLLEQAARWEPVDAAIPSTNRVSLEGHSIVMYYNIVENSGRGSIAVNVPLERLISLMEGGQYTERGSASPLAWKSRLRAQARNGALITLVIYDWPQGHPVETHFVRQVYTQQRC